MKNYKYVFISFFALMTLGTPWLISAYPGSTRFIDGIFSYIGNNYTAVLLNEVITISQLKQKYDAVGTVSLTSQPKVRVLIVPGHEPDFGGTEYGKLKERDIAVDLANNLKNFLQNNSHYEVVMARDKSAWNPLLDDYFKNNWDQIAQFVKESKGEMIHLINNGSIKVATGGVIHNSAPKNVALRLYGINKWSNENNIDIAIHLHFNDYPRRDTSTAGKYSGFAIYVPERQFSNSTTTQAIANNVFKRLSKYNAVSNLPKEDAGVVEEQELIAIGTYNTLEAPSMLIEYGYIYEPQFADPTVRESTLKDLAFQTYLGIQDFFGSGNDVTLAYDTLMLPHSWTNDITKDTKDVREVLALQSALMLEGTYPPDNKSINDCPRTGRVGPCTLDALSYFQNKHGIKNEKNVVGSETKKALNNLYSAQLR